MKKITYHIKSYLLLVMILFSYFTLYAEPIIVSGGPENDYESWIIKLNDGRLMVIFDRNPDFASGDLYVTFSSDNGDSWDSVLPIIEDSGDQATLSFLQLPDDTLRLWYASNESGTYGIYTAYSLNGIDWTKEGPIDLGWNPGVTHYDPTVILEPDSSLTMSYVVYGQGGYIANCPYGDTWDTLKTLVAPSGFRTRVMKHENDTYLYAYHRKSGPGSSDYDVFIRTSNDRINWSDSVRITYNLNSHDPFPNQTPDGGYLVYYAKYEFPAYDLHRRRSYNTIDWEDEEEITSDTTWNTQPHFFCESDEIYLIWAHAIRNEPPYDYDVYFERFSYSEIQEFVTNTSSFPFHVLPNPCKDYIIASLPTSHPQDCAFKIYNALGQSCRTSIMYRAGHAVRIDISTLSNGTYFLKIEDKRGVTFNKFTVIR